VKLRLRTAATKDVLFTPEVIWVWRTMVEWYRLGKTDLSTRALWQSYQQSSSSKTRGTGEGHDELCITKYLFHACKGSVTCRKVLRHGTDGYISVSNEDVLRIFISLKIHPPQSGANLGSNGKHANHYSTEGASLYLPVSWRDLSVVFLSPFFLQSTTLWFEVSCHNFRKGNSTML
jgi:hypothetical protein